MAVINTLSIPITDDAGKTKRCVIHIPVTATIAQIQAFWDVAILELDVVTAGVLSSPTLQIQLVNNGAIKGGALLDQFNQQGALMAFGAANTNYRWSQFVPAIRDSMVVSGQIDMTQAAMIAWRDRMLTGDAVVLPTDRYGNDLDAFIAAELSFRKK